ncbi:hypothetical protein N7510_002619 [Penicillium lagena]|uniref:uncharacterized protein n=1 Tax=Penicillium lagena TaxID=94218 RepID=UPI0025417629|nr:uncharacterized protein N7510_002619 [Penicillium lagena]KAJ5626310.1 hypothetical protein N7510_002619 [Penicillium lagena]
MSPQRCQMSQDSRRLRIIPRVEELPMIFGDLFYYSTRRTKMVTRGFLRHKSGKPYETVSMAVIIQLRSNPANNELLPSLVLVTSRLKSKQLLQPESLER